MVIDIKRCTEEKISIWCTTQEQAQQIWDDYHKYINKKSPYKKYNISNKDGFEVFIDDEINWQDRYNRKYFINEYNATKCLDYDEVLINNNKIIELW
jgi:hypothetical protein